MKAPEAQIRLRCRLWGHRYGGVNGGWAACLHCDHRMQVWKEI